MKRRRDSSELGVSPATRPRLSELAPEYIPLTSDFPDFSICLDDEKNKYVQSDAGIPKDKEILQESPLICWPLACSVMGWERLVFCEQCLKLIPADDIVFIASVIASSNQVTLSHIQCNAVQQQMATSHSHSPSSSSANVPSLGSFCSERCLRIAAFGGSSSDDRSDVGWFVIIGGDEGLRKLRASDWTDREGRATSCSTPISNESIARFLCSLAWRYYVLSKHAMSLRQDLVVDAGVEDQLFIEAGRPFERLVTSAMPSDYDSSGVALLLSSIIAPTLSAYLPPRLVQLLLQPDSISQICGQLLVNAQSLNVWGADVEGSLCVLKGAGVYTLQSCFNHSCQPNCTVSCISDSTITVTALQPIPANEQLTIAYIGIDQPVDDRRQLLATSYSFWCKCQRCRHEEEQNNNNNNQLEAEQTVETSQ